MHRLFGSSKPAAPAPNLTDVHDRTEQRAEHLSQKILALENQVRQLNEQLKKTRSPAQQQQIKRKMQQLLQQKALYVRQEDTLRNQQYNLSSVAFAIDSMKDTAQTVEAMQLAQRTMAGQMKSFNIDHIDDLQDQLADLMQDADEVSAALGRSYFVPGDLDDIDIDAELEALGDWEGPETTSDAAVPSYLSSLPSVDEYGLPALPTAAPLTTNSTPSSVPVPSMPSYGGGMAF